MSRARNSLLFTTIGPFTSWVLWLDSDIVETPPTLIQDLAAHDKPVLVPNCFQRFTNDKGQQDTRPYDYNSWQDSEKAAEMAAHMDKDDIIVEGYHDMPTFRTLMAMTADKSENRDQKAIISLDGVGGTALLVKAEVHRDGAMFPPFAFYHLMETEGFAKMARRLGWGCWGLPNYFVSVDFRSIKEDEAKCSPRYIITMSNELKLFFASAAHICEQFSNFDCDAFSGKISSIPLYRCKAMRGGSGFKGLATFDFLALSFFYFILLALGSRSWAIARWRSYKSNFVFLIMGDEYVCARERKYLVSYVCMIQGTKQLSE